jgi:hypothetical protein
MSILRKNNAQGKKHKKSLSLPMETRHAFISSEKTLFPEKLKKAQDILSKTKFLDR